MADKKQIDPRRPIVNSRYQILKDNYTATPNSATDPQFPTIDGVKKPETRANVNRGRITTRKDDKVQDVSIGLQDHDEAIMHYFNKVIKPSVIINGNRTNVPVIYGSPERWKSVQRDGFFRDKEGKLQSPIIMFKRDSVEKRRDLGNKLDGNNPQLYYTFQQQYTKKNQYDNFSVLQNRRPQREYHTVVVPDFVILNYTCIIFTAFIAQNNKLIEMINFTSDSYWGDEERFKFNAKIDTYSNTIELAQGSQRQIKTEFGLKLQGYLVPDSINKELAKKPQKYFSKSTVVFNDELIVTPTGIPKIREQVREATGKQNIQQAGTGVGYQIIGQTNQIG